MKIERFLINKLIAWKNSKHRKPLILNGVRQCGKTWLLQLFGKEQFKSVIYFNFEKDSELSYFFANSYDPKQIIMNLSTYKQQEIYPEETLIIFDEIQNCPRTLNSLKYFCEDAPEYKIASAGSLLGISLASEEGFPVGKVDFLELTPCSFGEYLHNAAPPLEKFIKTVNLSPIPEDIAAKLSNYFKEYLTIGGMPEAMSNFIDTQSILSTETILNSILKAYESDFSKHIPHRNASKLFLLWNSIPMQFGRKNGKFIFGEVRKGARAKEFEDALQWLINAFMVIQIKCVEVPQLPLRANEDRKSFKLYLSDVGLLRALSQLPPGTILNSKDIFAEFKGHFTENFVAQELNAIGISPLSYWTNPAGRAEVDFLIQHDNGVIPIEVKSGVNLRAQSLKVYREKYNPKIAIRFSLQNLKLDDNLLNVPLYLISEFPRLLEEAKERSKR